MTHTEKLSELTARIREALPRLKEETKGCKIDRYINDIGEILFRKNEKIVILFEDGGIVEYTENEYLHRFDVVGHEPMLNDVLEYRKKTLPVNEDLSSPFC